MGESNTASSRARRSGSSGWKERPAAKSPLTRSSAVRTDEKKILGGADAAKAKITGKIVEQGRGPKLKVLKFKTGGQYKIQTGHRQNYTAVEVGDITLA